MAHSSSANLKFADYRINLGSVPINFEIAPDIILLANSIVPTHNFKLEKEIISKVDKENASAKRIEEEQLASERTENKVDNEQKVDHRGESPLLDLNFGGEVSAEGATAQQVTDASSSKATPMAPITVATAVVAEPDNNSKLQIMIERTKQPQDVCYFYLECADWNLDNAVDLLNSMQSISN